MRQAAEIVRPSRDEFENGAGGPCRDLSPQRIVLVMHVAIGYKLEAGFTRRVALWIRARKKSLTSRGQL